MYSTYNLVGSPIDARHTFMLERALSEAMIVTNFLSGERSRRLSRLLPETFSRASDAYVHNIMPKQRKIRCVTFMNLHIQIKMALYPVNMQLLSHIKSEEHVSDFTLCS